MVHSGKIVSVDGPVGTVTVRLNPKVLIYVLYLIHGWMRNPVGTYNTVAQEVSVTWGIHAKVTSICPELFSIFGFLKYTLVYPVPYETSLKIVCSINYIPQILEVSCTVPHCVGILAKDIWSVGLLGCPLCKFESAWILRAINLGIPLQDSPFMLHRTHFVKIFQIQECLVEVVTVTGLVTHRPVNDACIILVAPVHIFHSCHMSIIEPEVIAQSTALAEIVVHTMRFYICLITYIYTVLIAKLIEICRLWVVAASYCIKVMCLHKFNV